jgi:hypothetical protein
MGTLSMQLGDNPRTSIHSPAEEVARNTETRTYAMKRTFPRTNWANVGRCRKVSLCPRDKPRGFLKNMDKIGKRDQPEDIQIH